jgi:hypothetical protein
MSSIAGMRCEQNFTDCGPTGLWKSNGIGTCFPGEIEGSFLMPAAYTGGRKA